MRRRADGSPACATVGNRTHRRRSRAPRRRPASAAEEPTATAADEPAGISEARLIQLGGRLRLDAAIAEVLARFAADGVHAIVVKGPSLARWLYDAPDTRTYLDGDLLVRPEDLPAAERALVSLGFAPDWDDRQMPEWWQEHAGDWIRQADGATIDLHRRLPGMGAEPGAVWSVLAGRSVSMEIGGFPAAVLDEPARALHVALHAAHHGPAQSQPLLDLERALERVDDATWRAAAEVAGGVDALDAFGAGLRLVPGGAALAARLSLTGSGSVAAELRAASPPPVALGFDQLASAGALIPRLRILGRKVVPPPAFIRHWDPRAAAGPGALLRAYLRRPVWLLRRAPAGWRAFRAAQGRARRP